MTQNRSHAVMAQRAEPADSLDDFPTPPWATRALLAHVLSDEPLSELAVLEPACNRGFMARVLAESFRAVTASDVHDYGYGPVADFLRAPAPAGSVDWVITNPPFKHAEAFQRESARRARRGVALLVRTNFLEGVGRYVRLYSVSPPALVAQFTERVPMVKGRVDEHASTATGYAWLVWRTIPLAPGTRLMWIPPCRKQLEREGDYIAPGAAAPDPTPPLARQGDLLG